MKMKMFTTGTIKINKILETTKGNICMCVCVLHSQQTFIQINLVII